MPSKKSKSKSASKRSSPTTNGGGGTRLSSLSGKKKNNNNLADEQAPPASEQAAAAAAAAAANSEAGAVDLESVKNGSEPSTADLTTTTTGGNEPFAASASRGGKGSSSIDINAAAALKSSAKSASTEVTRQRDNLSGRLSARSSFQSSVGSSQGMGGTGHATSSSNNNTFNARAVSVSSSEADAERRAEMVLSANRLAAVAAEGRNTSSIRRQKKAASEAGSNPSSTGSGGRSGGAGSSSAASHRTGSSIRSRYSNRYVAAAQTQSGRRSSDNNNSDLRDMYVDGGTDGGKRDSLPKRLGAQSSLLDMDGSNGNQSGLGSRSSLDRSSTNFSGSVKGGGSEFGDRSAMSITESARQSMAGGGRRASMVISKLNISPDQLIGREEEQKLLLDAFARTRGKDGASQISSPAPIPSGGADGGANGGVHHGSILEQDNEDDDENEGEGDEDTSPRNKNYRNTSSNSAAQDNDANSDMDFADLANVDVTETFPEIAMVHGRSGAGKTVFIQNTLRAHRKFFLQGKFDLHARSARPYAAFCDAFADLAAQIMDLPDSWEVQKALVDAVGDDGAVVICDLIPSLEDILEPTRNNNRSSGSGGAGGLDDSDSITSTAIMMLDTDVEAGPDELNRLQYMLRKMIGAVGTPERPVVLFLDDLHWADEPSLALLENLATDNHNGSTLIVGTYRSNEVDDEHPLIAALNNIKQRRSDGITDISLGNLSKETCLELVAEALRSTTRATQELGEVVYEKTSGNAFFVTAFLQALDSEGLITFNLGTFQWHWSLSGISKKHVSENVSDLMKLRLLDLNEEDQKVLMVASCLGCEFDQKTLSLATSMATGIEDVDLPRSLWNAVEGGVLRSVDNESLYAFVHDQIQFAAFVAIPETERNTFQACVGAAIIENAGPEALTGDLLLIAVDLCNCDSSQMKDRALLAKLNLKAGRSAVRSAAFTISASYFEAGLNLLDEEMYMSKMSLVIDLHTLFAQSLYCQGNFDRCIEVMNLRALEDKIMKPHQQTIFDYQIVITGTMILPFRQATLNLMGESDDPLVLTGEAMDEKELLDEAKAEGNLMCKNCVNSIRMELAFQFHEYVAAMEIADVLDPPEQAYPAFFQGIRQKLFEGLTCFALAREGGSNAKSLKRRGNFIIKQFSKLVWLMAKLLVMATSPPPPPNSREPFIPRLVSRAQIQFTAIPFGEELVCLLYSP